MPTPCCGNRSNSIFLVRHGFRRGEHYNRLEPSSLIHLAPPNRYGQSIDPNGGEDGDGGSSSLSAFSVSHSLFLVLKPQAWDKLLPSPQSHLKGVGL